MIYIGIDPGVSGGIAAVFEGNPAVVRTWKMPTTERDLLDVLHGLVAADFTIAALERVNPGVFGANKTGRMGVVSAFTFGRGVGRLEMALVASLIAFDYVSPATWQQALGCRSRGDKNITKRRAQQLFPGLTVTHAIADALLLAEYCRRLHGGGYRREERVDAEEKAVTTQGRTEAPGKTAREEILADPVGRVVLERSERTAERYALPGPAVSTAPRDGAGSGQGHGSRVRSDRRNARADERAPR